MTRVEQYRTVAYHGGQQEEVRWLTTDPEHAAAFGAVQRYRVHLSSALLAHADEVIGDGPSAGYDADEAAYALLRASGVYGLVIEGWEGSGYTILLSDSSAAEIDPAR